MISATLHTFVTFANDYRCIVKVVINVIQFLRGTAAQLSSTNQIVSEGQPVFEKDTGQLKIGDGTSLYKDLPYVGQSQLSDLVPPTYDLNRNSVYFDISKHVRFHSGIMTLQARGKASPFDSWQSELSGYAMQNAAKYRLSLSEIPNSFPYLISGHITPDSSSTVAWTVRCVTYGYSSDVPGYILLTVVANNIDEWKLTYPSLNVSYWAITTDVAPQS